MAPTIEPKENQLTMVNYFKENISERYLDIYNDIAASLKLKGTAISSYEQVIYKILRYDFEKLNENGIPERLSASKVQSELGKFLAKKRFYIKARYQEKYKSRNSLDPERRESMEKWLELGKDGLISVCPLFFDLMRNTDLLEYYSKELTIEIARIIKEQFNDNLDNYYVHFPDEFSAHPFQRADKNTRTLYPNENEPGYRTDETIIDENVELDLYSEERVREMVESGRAHMNDEGNVTLMKTGAMSQERFVDIISQAILKLENNDGDDYADVKLNDICLALYDSDDCSSKQRRQAVEVMFDLFHQSKKVYTKDKKMKVAEYYYFKQIELLDSAGNLIDESDTSVSTIRLHAAEALISMKDRLTHIPKHLLKQLDTELDKGIALPLYMEAIKKAKDLHEKLKRIEGQEDLLSLIDTSKAMTATFTLEDFQRSVTFAGKTQKKMLAELTQSLERYKAANALIEDFVAKSAKDIQIIFRPMSSAEVEEAENGKVADVLGTNEELNNMLRKVLASKQTEE